MPLFETLASAWETDSLLISSIPSFYLIANDVMSLAIHRPIKNSSNDLHIQNGLRLMAGLSKECMVTDSQAGTLLLR